MRRLVFAFLVVAIGCDGKPVTGPQAQEIVKQYKGVDLPSNPTVIVDGVRVPYDHAMRDIDPSEVQAIEILKGEAAIKRYGADASQGAIVITTNRSKARADSVRGTRQ